MTSHDVVSRVRRAVQSRAVGHTGTLDPFATGLLVILVGRATRLARFVEQREKTYLATARLGFRTTTDDRTGSMIDGSVGVDSLDSSEVKRVVEEMVGVHRQVPPAYSAKKIAGERSYRLARKGAEVVLAPAAVTVHRVDVLEVTLPLVTFRTTVSAGTYIRALARDLGERLGVGAHLDSLRREAIGEIRVEAALPLAELNREVALLPVDAVLGHLPVVELTESEFTDVTHGRPVRRDETGGQHSRLVFQGRVVGIAREADGWLRPVVVLEGN